MAFKKFYPEKIPVIISIKELSKHSELLVKRESLSFIIDGSLTIGELLYKIRRRVEVTANFDKQIVLMNGKTELPIYISIYDAYEKYKNEDGFLYMNAKAVIVYYG